MQHAAHRNLPPGVTQHAMEQQEARWGSAWSRAAWVDAVSQIIDRRAALLRSEVHRDRGLIEHWLVASPDGPARVVWAPNYALIVTVLPPKDHRNRGAGGTLGPGNTDGRRTERREGQRRPWHAEAAE